MTPMTLATLAGSAKQVDWAERIRATAFEAITSRRRWALESAASDDLFLGTEYEEQLDEIDATLPESAIELLAAKDSASWWIDRRGKSVGYLLASAFLGR